MNMDSKHTHLSEAIKLYCNDKLSVQEVSRMTNIPSSTLFYHLKKAGVIRSKSEALKFSRYPKVWKPEEIDILKKYYSNLEQEKLQQLLPHRTIHAIHAKARSLGLKRDPRYIGTFSCKFIKGEANEFEKGYVVGLLEGEGTISIVSGKRAYVPYISITNTERKVVETCQKIVGGKIITYKGRKKNHKDVYILHITKTYPVYLVLKEILPLMISERKRKIAELVLKFCELRLEKPYPSLLTQEEKAIVNEVRKLNKRGKVL